MKVVRETPIEMLKAMLDILALGFASGMFAYLYFWLFISFWTEIHHQLPTFFVVNTAIILIEAGYGFYVFKAYKENTHPELSLKVNRIASLILYSGIHWGMLLTYTLYSIPLNTAQTISIFILFTSFASAGGTLYFGMHPMGCIYAATVTIPLVFGSHYFGDTKANLLTYFTISVLGYTYYVGRAISKQYQRGSQEYKLQVLRADTMENLSKTDFLTKLNNRYGFLLDFDRFWRNSIKAETTSSLLFVEINNFSQIKLAYGESYSDACLVHLSRVIREHTPSDSLLARYSSDAITIALYDKSLDDTTNIAEKINQAVKQIRLGDGFEKLPLTSSAGISFSSPRINDDPVSMIYYADQALSTAKQLGVNNHHVHKVTYSDNDDAEKAPYQW